MLDSAYVDGGIDAFEPYDLAVMYVSPVSVGTMVRRMQQILDYALPAHPLLESRRRSRKPPP